MVPRVDEQNKNPDNMESSEKVVLKPVEGRSTSSRRSSQVTKDSRTEVTNLTNKPLTTREALIRLHDDLKQEVDRMKVMYSLDSSFYGVSVLTTVN